MRVLRHAWIIELTILAAIVILLPHAASRGWRIAFLTAGGPVIGAALMLLIARLTGADWSPFIRLSAPIWMVAIGAIGLGVIQFATPPSPHLAIWQNAIFVGVRAVIAVGALGFAATRITRDASVTFAGIALAAYAVVATPIATDWLLGGVPGHSVSAAGMMLFVEEIGSACATLLLLGWGSQRFRQDMAKLMVAAALGLSYLAFMDYLILWYGDLPSRVGWYVARGTPPMAVLAALALALGLFTPIALLALARGEVGRRLGGLSALCGLLLFNLWWAGGDMLALVAAVCAMGLLVAAGAALDRREAAHG